MAEEAAKDARRTGFVSNDCPGEREPDSPSDLSSLSDRDLGDLFDLFGAWQDYLSRDVGGLQATIIPLERQLKLTKAYLLQRVYTGPRKEREERVLIDPVFVELDARYAEAKAKLTLAEARLDAMSSIVRRISRHIALRQEQGFVEHRGANIAGMRRPSYGPSFLPPGQRRRKVEEGEEQDDE